VTPRTLLLAGLTALTLTTPAAAERVWTERHTDWRVTLNVLDSGLPVCAWITELTASNRNVGLVQFALSPGHQMHLSIVLDHSIAPDSMTGGAVLLVGSASYPVALQEGDANSKSRVTSAELTMRSLRPFLDHFADAARALLVMPSGDQITMSLRGTRASMASMARCMEQAQALNQAGPRIAPVRGKRT